MFFAISKEIKDNFPCHHQFGNFVVNTDTGWTRINLNNKEIIYKGYMDYGNLEDNIEIIINKKEHFVLGNFCIILIDNNTNRIITDLYRSFPIYFDDNIISNLEPTGETAWTNNFIYFDDDLKINLTYKDIFGEINTELVTEETAVDLIDEIISSKVKKFINHNKKPLKIFLSGGIDSMLVYSYIKKFTDNYELILGNHFDFDYFWIKNSGIIRKNYWAYNQLHHYKDSCIISSGAPGDEFMLRSPLTANLFLRYFNTSIPELLNDQNNAKKMQYNYFLLEKNKKVYKQQADENIKFDNKFDLIKFLCNININDYQHWHLGNTLTYTPLRDLEIFKIFLRLDLNSAINQIMDSKISKLLLKKNDPDLINCLSDSKNHGNYMRNLIYLKNINF